MQRRALPRMSAAKCSAPYSKGAGGRCHVSENVPSKRPKGVEFKVSGQTVEAKGPKGVRSFTATDDVDFAVDGNTVTVKPRGMSKRARQQWGMTRTMVANLATGVSRRLQERARDHRCRLSCSGAGQDPEAGAWLQPRRRFRDPRRDRDQVRQSRPRSRSPASTSSWSARRRPRSANGASPSPSRARGSSHKGEYIFRKEGKKK